MPDAHWGYGFPIGGVAATRTDGGVISPGGIGFDINCGVRLMRSDLDEGDVRPILDRLADRLLCLNVAAALPARGEIGVAHAVVLRDARGYPYCEPEDTWLPLEVAARYAKQWGPPGRYGLVKVLHTADPSGAARESDLESWFSRFALGTV